LCFACQDFANVEIAATKAHNVVASHRQWNSQMLCCFLYYFRLVNVIFIALSVIDLYSELCHTFFRNLPTSTTDASALQIYILLYNRTTMMTRMTVRKLSDWPSQSRLFDASLKPDRHPQLKLPSVSAHVWAQPPFSELHSSTSAQQSTMTKQNASCIAELYPIQYV